MATKMKKTLSLALALIMVLGMLPLTAFAAGFEKQVGSYIEYDAEGATTGTNYVTAEEATKTREGGKLTMSKSIEQTGENAFDITLLVTTAEDLENIPLSQDAAVVLLIDASTSMEWDVEGNDWNIAEADQRITLAKNAAKTFVNGFATGKNGEPVSGKRMVAVGSFNLGAKTVADWTDANDATKGASNLSALHTAIDGIELGSYTDPDAALQLAYNLLGEPEVADVASRFVILLTDGQPNTIRNGDGNANAVPGSKKDVGDEAAADAAGATAAALKQGRKATLYTLAFATANEECYETVLCKNCNLEKDKHTEKVTLCKYCMKPKSQHYKSSGIYYCSEDSWSSYIGKTCYRCPVQGDITAYDGHDVTVTVGDWLSSIASNGCYKNAATGDSIVIQFDEINEQIRKLLQAWQVTDPMGQYINYAGLKGDQENNRVTFKDNTLNWNLWDSVAKEDTTAGNKTYTYTLTYSVTLDTAAQGFQETENDADKFYATNGATKLVYVVNALNEDGTLNPTAPQSEDYFNVPSVNGTIPTVDFSIEYYKWDKKTGKYLDNPTDSGNLGSQKLWSQVAAPDGYMDKYNDDGYRFDSCNFVNGKMTVTNDAGGNVMKIYYKPVTTNVVVNRFFITHTTQLDGSVLDAQVNSTVNEHGAYVNDSFTAATADIDSYKFAESVQWGEGTKKSDSPTIAHLVAVTEENHNIINLYYEQSIDLRADASYTIKHHYAEQEWKLNADGKYELTTNKGSFGDDVTGKSKEGVVITATPNTRDDTYTVTSPTTEEGLKFTLVEGKDNGLTIEYLKAPTTVPVSTTVKVNHHYTTQTITIGGTNSATDDVMGTPESAHEGETWTFQPQAKVGFDISKVEKKTITLNEGKECYVVDFYYERTVDERVKTSVTVKTTENVYTMKVNEETGVAGYELTSSTAANPKSETFTKHANGDALYVGQTYAATIEAPNGFALNVAQSTENHDSYPLTETDNVINLVYDKMIDELAGGSATVIHKYTTYTDFVDENGDVQTDVATFFEERDESKSGKVGEWFMAEKKTVPTRAPDTLYTLNDGQDLKVTLAAVDAEKTLNYSRNVNLLAETNVLVNYYCVTNTRHVVDGGVVTTSDIETVVPTAEPQTGTFYAGLKFSISPAATRDGFTFDNTLTTDAYQNIRLSAKTEGIEYANTINLYYSKTVENLPTATVIVRDHYQTVRTYVNDAGVLVEDEKTVDMQPRDAVTPYIGTTYTASPDARDFVQTDAKYVLLGAPADASVLVAGGTNYVDFYYTKTVNPTVPATVVVTHHYKQVGWKGETLSSEEASEEPVTSVAGVKFTATVKTLDGYTLQNPAAVTLTLVPGENKIDLNYVQSVDNRVATTVLVKHHYDLVDPNVEGGLIHEGAHTQSYTTIAESAFVDNEFVAPQIPVSEGKTYTLNAERSDPTGGKLPLAALPVANVINLYYTRAYGDDEGFPVSGRKTYVGLNPDQYPTTTVYLSQAGVQKYSATVDNTPDGNGHFLFDNVAPGVYDISESASVAGYSYTAKYELTAHSYGQEVPSPQLRALVQDKVDITSNPQITVVAKTEYNLEITNTYTSNPTPPPTPGTTYYGITVKYVDEAGKELSAAHTERHYEGYSYDVTDKTTLQIADYTIKSVTGDTLSGRLNGDKVITVVYAPVVVIPDEPVPEGGKPGEVILPDVEPPKNELPEELEDGAVPLDAAPKTGDTTTLWTTLMAVSGFGLAALTIFKGKKKEEDSAE